MKKDTNDKSDIRMNIKGSVIGSAIGQNASVNANIIAGGNVSQQDDQTDKLFELILTKINARPIDPKVDKEEIVDAVEEIRAETEKGDSPDETVLKRRLRAIQRMAPDILEVIIETFKSPTAGIAAVIRKIALRVKEEAQA